MSAENDNKNETESKLMDDNERDKSYGTDGTVVISKEASQQQDNGNDLEEGQIQRKDTQNLLSKIRHINASDSHIGFLNRIVSIIFDTIVGIIALLIANIIQVICIVMGSVYIRDCPTQPGIPIILIFSGSINVLICVIESIKRRINSNSNALIRLNFVMTFLKLLSTVSFLIWIVVVYDSYKPSFDDPNAQNYCNKSLFLFAFWLLNSIIILLLIMLFIACCCCCCIAGAGNQRDN